MQMQFGIIYTELNRMNTVIERKSRILQFYLLLREFHLYSAHTRQRVKLRKEKRKKKKEKRKNWSTRGRRKEGKRKTAKKGDNGREQKRGKQSGCTSPRLDRRKQRKKARARLPATLHEPRLIAIANFAPE